MVGAGRKSGGVDDGSARFDDAAFLACRSLGCVCGDPDWMLEQRQSSKVAAPLAICRFPSGNEQCSAGAVRLKHRRRSVSN
jgi:hypothetical protein